MALLIKADGTITEVTPKAKTFALEELQAYVGGYIETVRQLHGGRVYVGQKRYTITDTTRLIVNEDGKRLGLPDNLIATALYLYGSSDSICGDVLLVEMGKELK